MVAVVSKQKGSKNFENVVFGMLREINSKVALLLQQLLIKLVFDMTGFYCILT